MPYAKNDTNFAKTKKDSDTNMNLQNIQNNPNFLNNYNDPNILYKNNSTQNIRPIILISGATILPRVPDVNMSLLLETEDVLSK